MIIGYARVSTQDQNPRLQRDALQEAGCEQIFEERVTGTKRERPELQACLRTLRDGDTVVVWKLEGLKCAPIAQFQAHTEAVRSVAFASSLSKVIACSSFDGTGKVFNVDSQQEICTLKVCLSGPEGRFIARSCRFVFFSFSSCRTNVHS